jgi:hypothetical protein
MLTKYYFRVYDTVAGAFVTGLTGGTLPTWAMLKKGSDLSDISSPATVAPIAEVGHGVYQVSYDPQSSNGEVVGVIDAGSGLTVAQDRYTVMELTLDTNGNMTVANKGLLDAVTLSAAPTGSAGKLLYDNLDAKVSLKASASDMATVLSLLQMWRSGSRARSSTTPGTRSRPTGSRATPNSRRSTTSTSRSSCSTARTRSRARR